MKGTKQTEQENLATIEFQPGDELLPLLSRSATEVQQISGVVVGELLGIREETRTPLVSFVQQVGTAAIPARSVVDLRADHIGKRIVLMFEEADPARPIVIGVLQSDHDLSLPPVSGQVEVESDGERVIVSAKNELVLRCGKASITLTKEGRLLLRGTHLSTHASGVNRIKGGSVQIN